MRAGNDPPRRLLPAAEVDLAVEVFRMLADGTRVQLLWALIGRELPVNELATVVGKPAPSVSQHLAKLRLARLVRTRREGTQVFYRLENDHIAQLVTDAVCNAEHAGPGARASPGQRAAKAAPHSAGSQRGQSCAATQDSGPFMTHARPRRAGWSAARARAQRWPQA